MSQSEVPITRNSQTGDAVVAADSPPSIPTDIILDADVDIEQQPKRGRGLSDFVVGRARGISDFAGAVRRRFGSTGSDTTQLEQATRGRSRSDYLDTMAVKRYSLQGRSRSQSTITSENVGRGRSESLPMQIIRGIRRGSRKASVHAIALDVLESTYRSSTGSFADDTTDFASCASGDIGGGETSGGDNTVEQEKNCFICMGKFTKKNIPIRIPCTAQCNLAPVHARCIYEWKEQKRGAGSCPLCRSELGAIDYQPPDVLQLATLSFSLSMKRKFCTRPLPPAGGIVRCYLRVRNGFFGSPVYYEMYLQSPTTLRYPSGPLPDDQVAPGDVLLMTARKRYNKWGNSHVEISLVAPTRKQSKDEVVGTVHSNMSGLEHTVVVPYRDATQGSNAEGVHEVAGVAYTQNRIGSASGPRQMRLLLPGVTQTPLTKDEEDDFQFPSSSSSVAQVVASAASVQNTETASLQNVVVDMPLESDDEADQEMEVEPTSFITNAHTPSGKDNTLTSLLKQGNKRVQNKQFIAAKNKEPYWLDSIEAYSLDFQGRVTLPSNKNFQLEADSNPESICLQFGKVVSIEDGHAVAVYTMDLQWPLSPIQALGICISSCDRKLACA